MPAFLPAPLSGHKAGGRANVPYTPATGYVSILVAGGDNLVVTNGYPSPVHKDLRSRIVELSICSETRIKNGGPGHPGTTLRGSFYRTH